MDKAGRIVIPASIRERLSEPLGDALDGAILLARTKAAAKEAA